MVLLMAINIDIPSLPLYDQYHNHFSSDTTLVSTFAHLKNNSGIYPLDRAAAGCQVIYIYFEFQLLCCDVFQKISSRVQFPVGPVPVYNRERRLPNESTKLELSRLTAVTAACLSGFKDRLEVLQKRPQKRGAEIPF